MSHQDTPVEHPPVWRPQRHTAPVRCLIALAVYVGVLAISIVWSRVRADPSDGSDYSYLTPAILAWWLGFPLVAGLWVRSLWWAPGAWLAPLLLAPVAPGLMSEQGAAFLGMVALVTGAMGAAVGRWVFGPKRDSRAET